MMATFKILSDNSKICVISVFVSVDCLFSFKLRFSCFSYDTRFSIMSWTFWEVGDSGYYLNLVFSWPPLSLFC